MSDARGTEDGLGGGGDVLHWIADSLPLLVAYIDSSGRYTFANDGYRRWFGLAPEQVVGRHLEEVLGPAAYESVRPHVEAALSGIRVDYESELAYTHGGPRTVAASYVPRVEGGAVVGFGAIVTDISARRLSEERLRASEERFRLMADHAPVLIWISDTTKACTWFNRPWLDFTGRTMEQEIGFGWAEGVHPDDRERCVKVYHEAFDAKAPFEMDYRLRSADGTYRWMVDRALPLYGARGEFTGYIGGCIDIHDRRSAEEALAQMNVELEARVAERTEQLRRVVKELTQAEQRERSRLSHLLHDDLQQVLVATRMQLDFAAVKAEGAALPPIRKAIELIASSIELSRGLAAELSPPVLQDGGLGAALAWLGQRFAQQHGLKVHVRLESAAEPATADHRIMLFHATRELLLNVVKHAATEEAWVSLVPSEDGAPELTVEDRGRGCNVAEPSDPRGGGDGFGLFHIRHRMQLVGGHFDIASGPSAGCRVTMRLPVEA